MVFLDSHLCLHGTRFMRNIQIKAGAEIRNFRSGFKRNGSWTLFRCAVGFLFYSYSLSFRSSVLILQLYPSYFVDAIHSCVMQWMRVGFPCILCFCKHLVGLRINYSCTDIRIRVQKCLHVRINLLNIILRELWILPCILAKRHRPQMLPCFVLLSI